MRPEMTRRLTLPSTLARTRPLTVPLISPVTRPTTNTRSRDWCVRAAVGMEMLVLSASPPPSSRICGRTNSTNSIEMIVPEVMTVGKVKFSVSIMASRWDMVFLSS